MEQEYRQIRKSSGFVYACANMLYRRVKTEGNIKYVKCHVVGCDGSAKLSHPNLYSFLAHLQQATTDQMNDVARIRNRLNIRRPKKKSNMLNDKRMPLLRACPDRHVRKTRICDCRIFGTLPHFSHILAKCAYRIFFPHIWHFRRH